MRENMVAANKDNLPIQMPQLPRLFNPTTFNPALKA